jgi:hypothetical protein
MNAVKKPTVMAGILGLIALTLVLIMLMTKQPISFNDAVNPIAESYVKLALAVGQHDADFVDAYYGPAAWQDNARKEKQALPDIAAQARTLTMKLARIDTTKVTEDERLRHQYLTKQLQALIAKAEEINGKRLSFDDEAEALYDVTPPRFPESHFQAILDELNRTLPGAEPLGKRVEAFQNQFIIPKDKLDLVIQTAIKECRARTKQHITLPADETFTVEYVTGKSWGAYNWYKGNSHSLIQVNTDLPIFIDRAVDLAAHEGYPGHHAYNALLEYKMLRQNKWIEFSIYPLFSPQSLIAEGTANFGIEVAFPGAERVAYEKGTLFPLAGLDTSKAELYYRVLKLINQLDYMGNEIARSYLDGKIKREEAVARHVKYLLMDQPRAERRVKFIDQYRSYIINYNYGKDLVEQYINAKGGTADKPDRRWEEFATLISSPRLPSGLKLNGWTPTSGLQNNTK